MKVLLRGNTPKSFFSGLWYYYHESTKDPHRQQINTGYQITITKS